MTANDRTYTTFDDAVQHEIREALYTSEDLTGPIDEAFDIDAIAEETIVQRVTDWGQVYFAPAPGFGEDGYLEADEFWEIVERHTR